MIKYQNQFKKFTNLKIKNHLIIMGDTVSGLKVR